MTFLNAELMSNPSNQLHNLQSSLKDKKEIQS